MKRSVAARLLAEKAQADPRLAQMLDDVASSWEQYDVKDHYESLRQLLRAANEKYKADIKDPEGDLGRQSIREAILSVILFLDNLQCAGCPSCPPA